MVLQPVRRDYLLGASQFVGPAGLSVPGDPPRTVCPHAGRFPPQLPAAVIPGRTARGLSRMSHDLCPCTPAKK